MKPMNRTLATLVAVGALGMAQALPAQAASHMAASHMKDNDVTIEEVQQAFARAADRVQDYTVDQREDALRSAREAIDVAEAEIRRMEDRLDRQWDRMSTAARRDARQAMREMNERRFVLARWYGSMTSSSKGAWGDIKRGFAKAFDDMERAMSNARAEFEEG